ncbi:TPA: REP-associated tyrosine transposase [Legionella anisa]
MHYRRVIIPGATYFFTVNLLNRKSNLLIAQIDKLRSSFRIVRNTYPFIIDGIVILPDHFHLLITLPEHDGNYSLRLRLIKSSFSKQIAPNEYITPVRKKKGERGIWQRRYWEHLIRDEKDYEHHLNYIYYNPVKHGYVKKPSAWPYSSIHRSIKKGVMEEDWAQENNFNDGSYGE